MLSSDTPTNDQNTVPFITPSPAVGEGLAPKAPLKKVCTYYYLRLLGSTKQDIAFRNYGG